MATHSSTLTWRIPWTEGPWGCKELDTTERLTFTFRMGLESEGWFPLENNIPDANSCSVRSVWVVCPRLLSFLGSE